MAEISPVATSSFGQTETSQSKSQKTEELGKDAFLLLLTTQMRYQDPLKPVDDTDFIAQLAQFSALEQMQNMNTALLMSQATGFVGKEVAGVDELGQAVEGVVTSVNFVSGKPYLIVPMVQQVTENGQTQTQVVDMALPLEKVSWSQNPNGKMTDALALTGKKVTGKDADGKTVTGTAVKVVIHNGEPYLMVQYTENNQTLNALVPAEQATVA